MIGRLVSALNNLTDASREYRALQPENSQQLTESLTDVTTLFSQLLQQAKPQNNNNNNNVSTKNYGVREILPF